ncbi:uncharacterized protein LOC142985967 [Anticarsia gemmatalis]|uniref:uncharacterized protein LOC142985967 n=1 Tax=Anticarsia gemmatalis TaxID=129554 RepID=UPI003F771D30
MAPINNIVNLTPALHESVFNLSDMKLQRQDLSNIKNQLDVIKQSTPITENVSFHDVHHYVAIYSILCIVILLGAAVAWRRLRGLFGCSRWSREAPTAPRAEDPAVLQPAVSVTNIIDLSQLIAYYYNNKIMFVIQIPLINPTRFNVYKNLPLPTPQEGNNFLTYVLIHPSKLYIAITDDRLNYAMLDDITSCKSVNTNYMICPLPSILSTINNPSCESKLLTEVTLSLPDICHNKLIYGNINIWQKLNNGKYIFVQSKPNKLTLKCNHNIKDYSLQGTGLLSLENDCIAYFRTLQFYPSHTYKRILPSQLSINYDITEDDCCKCNILNDSLHEISPVSLTNIDLESFKLASHKLDSLENQINNVKNQSHIIKYDI